MTSPPRQNAVRREVVVRLVRSGKALAHDATWVETIAAQRLLNHGFDADDLDDDEVTIGTDELLALVLSGELHHEDPRPALHVVPDPPSAS